MKNYTKKIYLIGIIFLSIILFNTCEQPVGEEEFPYELKLVIRSIIEPDQLINNIYIGRTLPVAIPFNESFANLTDAVGAVISDGIFYPLRHTSNGIYTTDSLIARLGKNYSLIVHWEGKTASAETTLPLAGSILSVNVKSIVNNGEIFNILEGNIHPVSSEAYAATWVLINFNGIMTRESESFAEVIKSEPAKNFTLKTITIPSMLLNTTQGYIGLQVYIYDPAFYDYFFSQDAEQKPDALFGQPGSNVKWNIKGNGIGMFIGRTKMIRML